MGDFTKHRRNRRIVARAAKRQGHERERLAVGLEQLPAALLEARARQERQRLGGVGGVGGVGVLRVEQAGLLGDDQPGGGQGGPGCSPYSPALITSGRLSARLSACLTGSKVNGYLVRLSAMYAVRSGTNS